MKILNFLSGYKTFIIGICAIVYGIHTADANTIIIGSGLMGLRQGMFSLEQQIVPIILNYFNSQSPQNVNVPVSASVPVTPGV